MMPHYVKIPISVQKVHFDIFSFWFFTTLFNQQWNKNSILTFVGAFIFNNSSLTNNFKIGQE